MLVILALAIGAYAFHSWLIISVTKVIDWTFSHWMTWVRPYGAVLNHSLPGHLPHFLFGVLVGPVFFHLRNSTGTESKS